MDGEPLVILMVEDRPDDAEAILSVLREHHVANRFHRINGFASALDYLLRRGAYAGAESSPRPHVVLLGLRLSQEAGLHLLSQIEAARELKDVPVVAVLSTEAEAEQIKAWGRGIRGCLFRPVDFMKFTQMMESLGFYWVGWSRWPWGNARGSVPRQEGG